MLPPIKTVPKEKNVTSDSHRTSTSYAKIFRFEWVEGVLWLALHGVVLWLKFHFTTQTVHLHLKSEPAPI